MVPVNSVNHTQAPEKTFSSDYKKDGNTSMKMVANNQAVHARKDLSGVTSGKYYLWYMDRYVKTLTSGVIQMGIYDINSLNNYSVINSTHNTDNGFTKFGGVFEGRDGGTRILYGRPAFWTGEIYIDNNTLIEISKADYDAFRAGTLTLSQIIGKYPVK